MKVKCPRCGEVGYLTVQTNFGREYLYVVHVHGKRRRKCYIGPAEGYKYVEKLTGIGLTNILDPDRYVRYITLSLRNFVGEHLGTEYMKEKEDGKKRKEMLIKKLLNIRDEIDKLISELGGKALIKEKGG